MENALTVVEPGSKIARNSVSIAICHPLGDKWQSKTLFLTIFNLCSLIVLMFLIATYRLCSGNFCHLLIIVANILGLDQDLPKQHHLPWYLSLTKGKQFPSNSSNDRNHINCAKFFGFAETMSKTLQYSILQDIPVADPEEVQGVYLNPSLWPQFLNIL